MDNKSKKARSSCIISRDEFKKLYDENNGFDTNLKNFHPDTTALKQFIRDEPEEPENDE